jgi:hypothetical protein
MSRQRFLFSSQVFSARLRAAAAAAARASSGSGAGVFSSEEGFSASFVSVTPEILTGPALDPTG